MRFNSTVEGARWDEDAQLWQVALSDGQTLSAQFLITATGFLSQPRVPDIPGIDTFTGRVIHTANWDPNYSLKGRRAAVIGTGSTGVQVIPEVAKEVSELTVYQRTPIWVIPKMDFGIAPAVQYLFAKLPLAQRVVRWFTDSALELVMVIGMWKFRYFKAFNVAAANLAKVHRFLSIRDKELRRKLNPDYDFGCKRPTLSNSYYRTFTKPHVHLETSGIERIESDGIVDRGGTKRLIDTLVLATGYDVWDVNMPAIEVVGREGRNLGKWWRDTRFQAYEGVSVPYFPNFLNLANPFAWVGLSWFNTMECHMRHMDRLFSELQRRGGRTFEVTEQANARFLEQMTELLDSSVFHLGNCATSRSYWFDHSGEAPLFRPTSVYNAVKQQGRFPLRDYAIA
jgi:cation diffusion facilitator CzcD-associated flavoprotein CzcO